MRKINALLFIVLILIAIGAVICFKSKETIIPKGQVNGFEYYKGISGKEYQVPLISDGNGKFISWLADVPWEELPLTKRLDFALKGGGLLSPKDISELWSKCGEWRKEGKPYNIEIIVND